MSMKGVLWITLLAGLWLIAAPFALAHPAAASAAWMSNDVVLGILLVAASGWALAATLPPVGVMWFAVLCGAWLVIAPFVLAYRATPAIASDVVCGIIAIVCGAIAARTATKPAVRA
jgi:hypothetical protein